VTGRPGGGDVAQAMAAGAEASREASLPPAGYPTAGRPTPGTLAILARVRARAAWQRWRWGIIGAALFLLFELVLFAARGGMGGHF